MLSTKYVLFFPTTSVRFLCDKRLAICSRDTRKNARRFLCKVSVTFADYLLKNRILFTDFIQSAQYQIL
jgi:hypothetical protein